MRPNAINEGRFNVNDNLKYPLREKRKQRTRSTLEKTAADLFDAQGYEATRLEQIAEEAGVHVQTLYRHFPTKEELAIAPDRAAFERFREAIEGRGAKTAAIPFWRAWVEDVSTRTLERYPGRYLRRMQQRDQVPTLAAAGLRLWHQYEDVLAAAIATDLGVDPAEDRVPRLFACMLWGGHQHALRKWTEAHGNLDLTTEALAVIDDVAAIYRAATRKVANRRKTAAK